MTRPPADHVDVTDWDFMRAFLPGVTEDEYRRRMLTDPLVHHLAHLLNTTVQPLLRERDAARRAVYEITDLLYNHGTAEPDFAARREACETGLRALLDARPHTNDLIERLG